MKLTTRLALAACSVALADDLSPPQISDFYCQLPLKATWRG